MYGHVTVAVAPLPAGPPPPLKKVSKNQDMTAYANASFTSIAKHRLLKLHLPPAADQYFTATVATTHVWD